MPIRFTPDVALAHPVVSDAVISPDGDVIAFVVADATRPSGPGRPAFARIGDPSRAGGGRPVDPGDIRPRRHNAALVARRAAGSPFSRTARCDGQRQVHLLPRDGGEARQLTHVESEIPYGRS